MAKTDNPVLGTADCPDCDNQMTVHQTAKGKGRFLYSRCPECNCDQRNGKAVQTRLWFGTKWRDDASPIKPPNVDEILAEKPVIEAEKEPIEATIKSEVKPVSAGPLALLGMVVLGVVAFVS